MPINNKPYVFVDGTNVIVYTYNSNFQLTNHTTSGDRLILTISPGGASNPLSIPQGQSGYNPGIHKKITVKTVSATGTLLGMETSAVDPPANFS